MPRPVRLALALAAVTATAACVGPVARQDAVVTTASIAPPAAETPGTSVATWQMPWQISPATVVSEAQEETSLAFVPGTGYVRGTRTALDGLGRPLAAAPGRNRTVEACRTVVTVEARKIGATEVEVVSAGPHRTGRDGRSAGPVDIRITYARPGGYEVRIARMTCIVDRRGGIVDAFT